MHGKKKKKYIKQRDYVTMGEILNGTGGPHESRPNKSKRRSSKENQQVREKLKQYYR